VTVASALTCVRLADTRQVATPAATMRTYASPSGPAAASVALWRTEMTDGAVGPAHTVSDDQVLVVMEGSLHAVVGGDEFTLGPRDAVVLPAEVERQLIAGPDGAVTLVASLPGSTARVGDGEPVPVPWAR
jgi:quercetin dioxygenase-like cupin family protein